MDKCNVWSAVFETKAGKIGAFIHAEPEVPQQVIENAFLNMKLGKFKELSKAICIQHLIEGKK